MKMYSGIFAIILNEINIMRQKFWAICLLLLPLLLLCSCEPEGREEGGDGLSGMLTADPIERRLPTSCWCIPLPTRTETA